MIEIVVVAQPNALHLGLGRNQNLHLRRAPPLNRAEKTHDNPLLPDRPNNRQCALFLFHSSSRLSSHFLFLASSKSISKGILSVLNYSVEYRISI